MQSILIFIITSILSLSLIGLALYIVSKYNGWFVKNRLKLLSVVIVMGTVVYAVGYLWEKVVGGNMPSFLECITSGLMAIFSMGRMFMIESDIAELGNNLPIWYRIMYGIVMDFSMVIILSVAFSFFGYRFACRISLLFTRLFKNKNTYYVFTIINESALILAEDIKKNHPKSNIIFCINEGDDSDEAKELEKKAARAGYLLADDANSKVKKYISKLPLYYFAIDESDAANTKMVCEFVAEVRKNHRNKNPKIYAFLKNADYQEIFSDESYSDFEIDTINYNDLVARQLFERLSFVNCFHKENINDGKLSEDLTVAVVGFSSVTTSIYQHIAYMGQFYGSRLTIIAIGETIKDKIAIFLNQNPEITSCLDIQYLDVKICSTAFFDYFKLNSQKINSVIITDESDEMSMASAAELNRVYAACPSPVQIAAKISCYSKYEAVLQTEQFKNVILFGDEKSLYTEQIVVDEQMDLLAKAVHNYYCACFNSSETWKQTKIFSKKSSRAVALHIQSKLMSIGLQYQKGEDTQLLEAAIENNPDIIDNLSRGEHMRWNAYHFVNGFRKMPLVPLQPAPKNNKTKQHACLVSWEELVDVGRIYHKDYQDIDIHIINNLGNIVRDAGLGIIKIQ